MDNDFWQLVETLTPRLRAGEIMACTQIAIEELHKLPETPFHCVCDLSITNEFGAAVLYLDRFLEQESINFPIVAVYTEMNGFNINTDRWFCSVFAYSKYGGHEDYGWLAEWQSAVYDDLTITGLEELQSVFASDAYRNPDYNEAGDLAELLVVLKFQQFVQELSQRTVLNCPILSTAHDWDFIAEASAG